MTAQIAMLEAQLDEKHETELQQLSDNKKVVISSSNSSYFHLTKLSQNKIYITMVISNSYLTYPGNMKRSLFSGTQWNIYENNQAILEASFCDVLNPDKTEFMRCTTARRLPQLAKEVVTFGNSSILPATTVRNLGVVVDQKLSFQSHVNKTVSSCFYQLRRLKSSVKALPFETAKTLVNSFVISRIDYCNSILAGAPQYLLNRLQRVMNEAARMLCRCSRGDHVNRIMKERLHWLRIPQRIQFKLCLLVYKSLHSAAPTYLSELVNQVNKNDARRRLRSATIGDLIVPRTRTNFGQHAFATAGPVAWNSLPKSVLSASSIASFKKKLKTHFFNSI